MKFVDESERFASLGLCPFGRRGSYFAVCLEPGASDHFGRSYVYLATCHGAATAVGKRRLYNLQPVYEGERVPFASILTPTELILRTLYGDVRICIAKPELILFHAENGLGLRFATTEELDRITKPRGKTAWETIFNCSIDTVLHSIRGRVEADVPWDWDRLRTARSRIDMLPDEDGVMDASLEEFQMCGYVRSAYPTYAEGLAIVKEDWETFLAGIPALPGRYEAIRPQAAYCLWSYLVRPYGLIRRDLLYMSRFGPASAWQHTFQTVAYGHNYKYGWSQLLNPFVHQGETGQLPDFYDDNRGNFSTIRPPIQGWALKKLRKYGYYEHIPKSELEDFYPRLAAWADYFDKYRTEDSVEGLPHYENSDESGMEDGTTFRECCLMATPDLPAYLVLLYEELGEMSQDIGKSPSVKEYWYKKAEKMQAKLIEKLWNGERFVSHTMEGKEIEKDYGILGYMPVVLGKRLPEEILSKLVADLKIEGYVLSDYGFDKEKQTGRDLCDVGRCSVRGYNYQPFNLLLISSLYDECGEEDFARDVANRFCGEMLEHGGVAAVLNSYTGAVPSEWISWTAGAYLLIARYTE